MLKRSTSAIRTRKIGELLAKKIMKETKPKNKAVVLALEGELGAGKTTFLQGLAKGLGIKEKINSPTFVIFKKFSIFNSPCLTGRQEFSNFYHFDCYRIGKPKEILDLGWEKIINNPQNIVAIEWPERITRLLPRPLVLIQFKSVGKNRRNIIFAE